MKKCLASRYIKKTDLRPEENKRILQDLFAFNSMKRTSFLWQRQGRKFLKEDGKELSHQLKLKEVFACNDYFANSARMAAAAMIKSGQELAKLYIEDAKEDIKAIRKALRKKKNYRKKLLKIKESIIKHTKDPKKAVKGSANIQYEKDGSVTIQFFQKVWTYETRYLFEHQWLDRKLRQLKTQIANMEHKMKRLEIKQQRLKDHPLKVRFGGKKLTKNRTIPERHRALEKRRNRRMQISGRKDCKYGNWVFRYVNATDELADRVSEYDRLGWKQDLFSKRYVSLWAGMDRNLVTRTKRCDRMGDHRLWKCLADPLYLNKRTGKYEQLLWRWNHRYRHQL